MVLSMLGRFVLSATALLVMKSFHLTPRIRLGHVMWNACSLHESSFNSVQVSAPWRPTAKTRGVNPQLSSKTHPILAPNLVQLAHHQWCEAGLLKNVSVETLQFANAVIWPHREQELRALVHEVSQLLANQCGTVCRRSSRTHHWPLDISSASWRQWCLLEASTHQRSCHNCYETCMYKMLLPNWTEPVQNDFAIWRIWTRTRRLSVVKQNKKISSQTKTS